MIVLLRGRLDSNLEQLTNGTQQKPSVTVSKQSRKTICVKCEAQKGLVTSPRLLAEFELNLRFWELGRELDALRNGSTV